ncbi:aromatic amino acid transport family protein [Helicobacter sp. 11S03491-1]|uniref:aromatic amino acid transport family protein n=1 Tax=Helicobacter sp. 11S03491-1 TaxID=1476196 RepID=UPI000BA55496|nr:aromatic amino acid transport family protein [Helicobacter sp. 11S03491-1]PAF41092.1 HAAAP family serine/threonine permease [Helicobacter sp. 11S03491-1]
MNPHQWNKIDTRWMFALFGTAVGAGILYLPIEAGKAGIWPIIMMCLFVFPMTFLSHRALSRLVISDCDPQKDITHVVEEYFGIGFGKILTILYFISIYPMCLIYGVGLTTTINEFLHRQLHISFIPDFITAFIAITFMFLAVAINENLMLKLSSWLIYPLTAILFIFSLYLIPYWNFKAFSYVPGTLECIKILYLSIPVLVFAFDYSAVISYFSLDMKQKYGKHAPHKSNQILFRTSMMLAFFIMFFVFSCAMCLDLEEFEIAHQSNITILSYFANKFDNPFIAYVGPIVAFSAIVTSFFGHYLGAREGLNGMIYKEYKHRGKKPDMKKVQLFSNSFIYITMIGAIYANPSILDFIESLGGPIIAMILFLLPMYAIYKVPSMKQFQKPLNDYFTIIIGVMATSGIIIALIRSIINQLT